MTRARAAGVVLLLVACLLPGSARASSVTADQLRDLAAQAQHDRQALAELRDVDSVDGLTLDVRGALRDATPRELRARLRALARSVAEPAAAAGDPRGDARDVLSEQRFQRSDPRPLRRPLEWLAGLLPDIGSPLDWLDDLIPGPRWVVWIVLGGLFGGIAFLVARRVLARRVRSAAAERAAAVMPVDDPRSLERRADAAEAAGDLDAALRLRFRAGLLRLDARGRIEYRPSISTYEVRRALNSHDFDALAATFDDVVYGGRPAERDDVHAARERWKSVVETR